MSFSTFWSATTKRKRKSSSTASSVCYDDDEISFNFYASPEKKKRKMSSDRDVKSSVVASVDEDISFKLTQPTASKATAVDEDVTFRVRTTTPTSQLVDEDISFKITDAAESDERPLTPRVSPNGYILPDPLPEGLVVTDLRKGRWRIGRSVGLGGFGEVYSAASLNSDQQNVMEDYVVKVEPHSNGPLFMEISFYMRAARLGDITDYKAGKCLEHLGVPHFVASGSFMYRGKKLRFLVLPRFGLDLQSILDSSRNILATKTATSIACQVIDAYEYLHENGFAHKDLKGSNLLFSRQGPSECKVFLVDYGLASKLTRGGIPKPYIPDKRSAHEGTLEFCSRDAHLGCISRRGDFEVLLFNLIDWFGGKLPWEKSPPLKPMVIHEMKIIAFEDVSEFFGRCFEEKEYPAFLETFMDSVGALQFNDTPDYDFFRAILREGNSGGNSQTSSDDEVSFRVKMIAPTLNLQSKAKSKKVGSIRKRLRRPQLGKAGAAAGPIKSEHLLAKEAFERACLKRDYFHERECLRNPTPAMLEQLQRMINRPDDDDDKEEGEDGDDDNSRNNKEKKKRGQSNRDQTSSHERRSRKNSGDISGQRLADEVSSRSPSKRINTTHRNPSSTMRQRIENAVNNLGVTQFLTNVSRTLFSFQK